MAEPQISQITQSQTTIPDYAKPFVENLLGQAQSYTDPYQNPYMQYMGQRQAQFSPLQQLSYDNAALMKTAPQLGDATAMAGMAGLGALNTSFTYNPYTAQQFTNGTNAPPGYNAEGKFQPGTGAVGQYMSPYMDTVVARQQQDLERQGNIARQTQNAQAARSGAFGGSGNLIANNQLNAQLARQKGDVQAKGLQDAYSQAMNQFNTQQGQNQAAAQLNAQQGQFGAGLGLQGLQTALTASQNLGNLGNTQYNQNMGINQMQNQYGLQQQQQQQNILNNQYQDFLNNQNNPYKQMGFMSDILRGLPLTQQSASMYQTPPSAVSQAIGLGGAALTGAKLFGAAGGATGDLESRPSGLADLAIYQMGQD
jgi:hypothetical protein